MFLQPQSHLLSLTEVFVNITNQVTCKMEILYLLTLLKITQLARQQK